MVQARRQRETVPRPSVEKKLERGAKSMNAPCTIPRADQAAIIKALAALFPPDDVIELRSFPKGRKRTDAGYFDGDHRHQLAEHAAMLNQERRGGVCHPQPDRPAIAGALLQPD
jgi:hypothetical protein